MTLANEKHGSLYIMRHGKTDWNEKHKIQGRTDIPLNDEGRKMAAAAAEEYKDIHFDMFLLSSDTCKRDGTDISFRQKYSDYI